MPARRDQAKEFDHAMTLHLTKEMRGSLQRIASKRGCSTGVLIREYVEWGLEQEQNDG